jgi:hypothetical protein
MKFDHNQHLIVCVDRATGNHFHVGMPEFSAAEAQFEQQPSSGTLSDEEIQDRLAALESAKQPQPNQALLDLAPLHDRIAGLEQALAEALRLMEARASTPAPADELIVPTSWPVAAADMVVPAPPVARHATRDKGSLKDAMRRVEEAEDFDAPLPEYVPPPPEPTAADVFDVTREFKQAPTTAEQEPARKRLRTAYSKACAALNEDRWEYDIAVMAGHGNNEQAANLDMTAKRRGVGVQDVADEIITNYRGCERALSAIREINEIALTDMVARPGDSQAIVNEAIGLINEMVGHATAYRT